MRLRTLAATSTMAAFLALTGPGNAAAATEFGDACTANKATLSDDVTIFEASAPGNPLPVAAPSAGVITAWKTNIVSEPLAVQQTLQVLHLDQGAKTAQVVGEASATLTGGANTVPARLSVDAGDRLALHGLPPVGTLYCKQETATYAGYEGFRAIGTIGPYAEASGEVRVPVVGVLEPDVDSDGYGDETQDKCPRSAAVQTDCPVVILDAFVVPRKGSVTVVVSTSTPATVTASAAVKLPKAPKKATASALAKLKKVTHTVTPGKLGRFSLKYPASLKQALATLPAGRALKLKITASAIDAAGQVTKDKTTVKLKGSA